jgi:hypothetical protein
VFLALLVMVVIGSAAVGASHGERISSTRTTKAWRR